MLGLSPGAWGSVGAIGGAMVLVAGGAIGKMWTDRKQDKLSGHVAAVAAETATATAQAAKEAADMIADTITAELSLGNGHTAGQGIARLEERGFKLEMRMDALQVTQDEHAGKMTSRLDGVEAALNERTALFASMDDSLADNTKRIASIKADMAEHDRQLAEHAVENRAESQAIKDALEAQQVTVRNALNKEAAKVKDALDEAAGSEG